jgi:CRISPR-associated endonuclease/helicase Cas3
VRLVATSLVEAGVDISFPEVWRAATGLESVAQAAGRCNREGELREADGKPRLGHVVVFEARDAGTPREMKLRWQAAQSAFKNHREPLWPDAIRDYFKEFYWRKGETAFDGAKIGGRPGILAAIRESAPELDFPFASIARSFRMIEEAMEPVIVPWRMDETDSHAETILARIVRAEKPARDDLRALQQYVVGIPRLIRDEWLAREVLKPVHPQLGEAMLRFEDCALYRPDTGLDTQRSTYRDAEANVF